MFPGATVEEESKPEAKKDASSMFPGATVEEQPKPEAKKDASSMFPGAIVEEEPKPQQKPPPAQQQPSQALPQQPPLEVPKPTLEGPTTTEAPDPQAQIRELIAQGKSPGEAQAIVTGQQPKTISGEPPKPKPEPKPEEPQAPQVPAQPDLVLQHSREILAQQAAEQKQPPQPSVAAPSKPEATFIQAKSFTPGKDRPIQGIILHSTDGEERGDIDTLTRTGVSVHYYVTRTGKIYQFVNDGDVANHAGKTSGTYSGYNNANTIGIEQEHYDRGGKGGKYGQDWPEAQVQATARLVAYLQKKYGLTNSNVFGHSDVAPERKQDPYNYPWDKFHQLVQQGGGAAPGEKGGPSALSQENTRVVSQLNKSGLNTTRYGYADDPDLDPESKAGHGKYVAHLQPGYDVALNTAAAAKVGNPKPGSVFKFAGRQWRYGDAVPERYKDARFDIYDPNGEFAGIGGGGGKVARAGPGAAAGPPGAPGPLAAQPLFSVATAGPSSAGPAEPQRAAPFQGGEGVVSGRREAEGPPTYISLGGLATGAMLAGALRGKQPQAEEEEEEDPMVTALMSRGFSRPEALRFAQSSQLVTPGKGVGPLPGQPPPAPTQPQLLPSGVKPAPPSAGPAAQPIKIQPIPSRKAPPIVPPKALPAPAAPTAKRPGPPAAPAAPPTAKAPTPTPSAAAPVSGISAADKQAAVQSLMGLGLKKAHAQQLVESAPGNTVDEVLRNALKAHGQGAVRGVESGSFRAPPPPAPTAATAGPSPAPTPVAKTTKELPEAHSGNMRPLGYFAAVRLASGEIFGGRDHAHALHNAQEEASDWRHDQPIEHGFIDKSGRFVTMDQADRILERSHQAPSAKQEPALEPEPAPAPRPARGEPTAYEGAPAGSTHRIAKPASFSALTPGLKLSEAVKKHADLLSEDDPRVKKQADGMIKGEHFVEGDPVHDELLNGLPGGKGGQQRQMLAQAERAIAEHSPMHISYLSAPKEAQRYPTRESRTVQYEEHSPEARLMGTTTGQLVAHSFIPVAAGVRLPAKAGEPHQGYIQGISTNVLANNFQHLNDKLTSLGLKTPYKSLGHKFYNDLEGYYSNLNAGHTATGRGYAVGTEHHPVEPDTSHVPYKLSRQEADFIGTVINNTAAFAQHEDAQKLRELAKANGTLITEAGETNRMRHQIEQHDPGWRKRVLEPSIRSFKTGLIVAHHPDERYMPETIRPGKEFQELTRAIQRTTARGRPDVPVSISLHHTFQDYRLINKIERDFSSHKIDEAEARRQLQALGEDPDQYRFEPGSGGLITPYEDDPEAITPEEHAQMRDNLRKQWVGGKLNVDDYRKKAAEVPLPSKPSQAGAAPPKPLAMPEPVEPETPEEATEPMPITPAPKPKRPSKPVTPEPEEQEEPAPKAPAAPPAAPAAPPPKPQPKAPVEPPAKPEGEPEPEAPVTKPKPQKSAPPPALGEVLPATEPKTKKAAKSEEQKALEAEDLRQADIHRKTVSPERQAARDEIQQKAQQALGEAPETDPLSAHHYINKHATLPDWIKTKEDIGKHFDEVNPKLDYAKDEHRQRAADALTHDVLHGLSKNSAAYDWYDDTVDKSLNHIGHVAPKILSDRDHELAFKLATAVTSQGQDVFPNFESGYLGYRHWHKTGRMPEDASIFGGGPKAEAMVKNFKKINKLWGKLGSEKFRQFLETPITMRQLKEDYGMKSGGESPDHEMEGAAFLGPKIGSFFNNLNKRFHSTTFDLWATRNLNRIAGRMLKFSPNRLLKDSVNEKGEQKYGHLSRLDQLLSSDMIEGADKAQQKTMRAEVQALRKLKNPTRERVLGVAPTIADWAEREHNRYAKGTGGRSYPKDLKTASTSLAKNMDLNLTDLSDAPRGPVQRKQFRDIYKRTQANLAKHGINMEHANNQAVLWYIEQKLFQLGGSRNRASFDYLDAAHRLVRKIKSGELPSLHAETSTLAA
jgi:N-acetyl-anhydromuramyl-L-alanine amidase AmpD